MGTASAMGEGLDSMHIGLPECQELFLKELKKLNKKVIGIHLDGRPVTSDLADEVCNAIIEAWSPAECGAQAITDVLLGEYNPSGKLSVSVPRYEGQIPVFYNHKNGAFQHKMYSIGFPTYVDGPVTPRYPFGFGLSYTTFSYSDLTADKNVYLPDEELTVSCRIKNTGSCYGEEIVQLYISDEYSSMVQPNMSLQGFSRVALNPGEEKTVTFTMPLSQFAFLDADMRWKVEKGNFTIYIGSSSADLPLRKSIAVSEDAWVDGKKRGFFARAVISGE